MRSQILEETYCCPLLDQHTSNCILNTLLHEQRRASLSSLLKKLPYEADGDCYGKPQLIKEQIVGRCPALVNKLITQLLNLKLRKHKMMNQKEESEDSQGVGCKIVSPRNDREALSMLPQHMAT